jgi:TetR/AcrR family transcriptional regulator
VAGKAGGAARSGRQSAEAAEQTRRDILDAALYCFANQGFTSTSLRDIAERANTAHGVPRHHFGSKEDLWKACAEAVVQRVADAQLPALEVVEPETALESLENVARVFLESAAAHPDFWRLVAFEALKESDRLDYLIGLALPQHARVAELFDMVKAQGHLQHFDNNSFFLSLVSMGAIPFALAPFANMLSSPAISTDEGRDRHVELVINTLFRR